jgi:hypothetical protein
MGTPINRESDPRWARLREYVADAATRLGLGAWRIRIEQDAPEDPEDDASIHVPRSVVVSRILFGDSFFAQAPEEQRATVAHELLHLITAPVDAVIDYSLDETRALSPQVYGVIADIHHRATERMVDGLSYIIAPTLPLPDLGDGTPDAVT